MNITSQRREERLPVTRRLLAVLIFVLMIFPGLVFSPYGTHGDPTLQDNGDGTFTVTWSLDDSANYTTSNASVESGSATLGTLGNWWNQTSQADFESGMLENVTTTPVGDVLLSGNRTELIRNGDLTTGTYWVFSNSSGGNVVSEWSPTTEDIWMHGEGMALGQGQGVDDFMDISDWIEESDPSGQSVFTRNTLDSHDGDGSSLQMDLLFNIDGSIDEYLLKKAFGVSQDWSLIDRLSYWFHSVTLYDFEIVTKVGWEGIDEIAVVSEYTDDSGGWFEVGTTKVQFDNRAAAAAKQINWSSITSISIGVREYSLGNDGSSVSPISVRYLVDDLEMSPVASVQFDSLDDVGAMGWYETYSSGSGDFSQNLVPPIFEGSGDMLVSLTFSNSNNQYGMERNDAGQWNWSGFTEVSLEMYTDDVLGETVHLQLAGEAGKTGTFWTTPKQTILAGWNTCTFNITGFEGSGGNKNSLSAVDAFAMLFKDSPVGITVPVYVDDIRLISPGSSQTSYDESARADQTFRKASFTPISPGQVNLAFDYAIEEVLGVTSADISVFVNGTEVWTRGITSVEPWTPVFVDISQWTSAPGNYQLIFRLRLQVTTQTLINVSARIDNVSIIGAFGYNQSGTLISSIYDAGNPVIWKQIGWNVSTQPTTSVVFQTRTGYSPTIDGSWSNWSTDVTNPSGENITSPAARYIQYKAILQTGNASYTPLLTDVYISYQQHYRSGMVETLDFTAPSILSWNKFNSSHQDPSGTNLTYSYSTDSGSSWFNVLPGESLVGAPIPTIRFKARLETVNVSTSPILFEMSLTYLVSTPLDHIHMSLATWSGTTDDSVGLDAIGHDAFHNPIAFVEKWETDDPWGTVDAFGVYLPGMVGSWRVYCNNTVDTISNYTLVNIVAGGLTRIGIDPWDPGVLTTDDTMMFNALGYDSKGNSKGLVNVTWSVTGGIGTIPTGPSSLALFDATTPGIGTVGADDGLGHTNSTSMFQVVEGSLDRIVVQPDGIVLGAGELQNFTSTGYDSDGNVVAITNPVWDTNAGTITNPTGTSATLEAYNQEILDGWISITAPFQDNITDVAAIVVLLQNTAPTIVGVIPNQIKPEDHGSWTLDLQSFADDSQDPLSELTWSFTGHDSSLTTISGDDVQGNHVITFTTVENAYGSDEVVIWLKDSQGLVDGQPMFINITSVNDRPMITSIAPFTVHYDDPYTYYFYDYVSDVESAKEDLVLSSSDPDHISFNGLWGTFNYPEEFNGKTEYPILTVFDEDGGEMSTILGIRISDDYVPVLAKELPDVILYEGQEIKDLFDLDDYFTDPDGDSLFFASGNIQTDIIIHENHSVDFIAPDDWHGTESVSFRAIDPHNARAEDIILVTVLPVNDPPTIQGVPDLFVHYDDMSRPFYNYTFDLEPYIHDVDNPVSDLSITTNDPTHIYLNGTKSTIMELHYPVAMMGQTVIVRITVSDGSAQDYQDINITITDDWPPEIVSIIPEFTFFEDTTLPLAFKVGDYFADNDADELTYSAISSNVIATIDNASLYVDLSATPNWFGNEPVTFRAMDPDGAIAEQTTWITVLPVNDAPEILNIPDITLETGEIHTIDLTEYVLDIDNNLSDLIVFVSGDNSKVTMTLAGFILVLSYPTSGTDHIHVEVSDGSLTTHRYFDVRIVSPPISIWDQVYWPWSLIVIILAMIILFILTREILAKIHIDEVFLIYRNGSLIHHSIVGEQTDVDEDIFSNMLTAIQEFVRESFKQVGDSRVKKIEFGKRKILIERGEKTYLAVVYTGHENRRNLRPIEEAIEEIEIQYEKELDNWDGFILRFAGVQSILNKHLGDLKKGQRNGELQRRVLERFDNSPPEDSESAQEHDDPSEEGLL